MRFEGRRRTPAQTAVATALFAAILLGGCVDDSSPVAAPESTAVRIEASGCGPAPAISSGGLVDDGLVLTVGHGVQGSTDIAVVGNDGRVADATVIAIDTVDDLALLQVPSLDFPLDRPASFGPPQAHLKGEFIGFGGDGDSGPSPFVIRRRADLAVNTPDGSDEPPRRAGSEVAATVSRGDSGALLHSADGTIVGMLFATSQATPETAYATSGLVLERFVESPVSRTQLRTAC